MNDEPKRTRISEGVLLAAASAAGVWFAYLYEWSRLSYYRIPLYEVPITARHIAWAAVTASVSAVWWIAGAMIGKYSALLTRPTHDESEPTIAFEQRQSVIVDLVIVGGIFLLATTFHSWWWAVGFLLIVVLGIIVAYARWLPMTVGEDYTGLAALFFMFCIATWTCTSRGAEHARNQVVYHVIPDRNLALVNSNSGRNVFVGYDPAGRNLTGVTRIVTDEELGDTDLVLTAIGPLMYGPE